MTLRPGWDEWRSPWMRSPAAAVEWWVGAAKAIRRGSIFPAQSRRPWAPAPGGTSQELPRWSPLRRMLREQSCFVHSHHRLTIPGLTAPLRLLQLSDVHLRGPGAWLDGLCRSLTPLRPDLLVLTGDMVTAGWSRDAAEQFVNALPAAPLGRFHVTGNWETILGPTPLGWTELLSSHGIRCLDNRRTRAGPVLLAGVEDLLAGDAQLETVLGPPTDRPLILLAHTPMTIDEVVRRSDWCDRVQLVLSGHSHAGQIRLPLVGSPWLPKGTGEYVGGWYEVQGVPLFVSRGVGWSLLPLRLWCPPELAVIELTPARSER